MLDSQTLCTIKITTIKSLLDCLDTRLTVSEHDIVDALTILYDKKRDDEVDFDEFLYQLALLNKVTVTDSSYDKISVSV